MVNNVNCLVCDNINLVHYFAQKIKLEESGFYDYEDIFQIGSIGLVKAAKTFNGSVKFSTYASRCISNEIYMFLRKKRHFTSMKSLNEVMYNGDGDNEDITLLDIIPDRRDVYLEVEKVNEVELLYNVLLNNFSYNKILLILKMSASKRQKDIAKEFNISQSYVSRLFNKLINELKKDIQRNKIKKRRFNVQISTSQSQISFYSLDKTRIKDLIISLKSIFSYIENLNITYSNNLVRITVPYSNVLLDIISIVIQNIYDNSINVPENLM